MSNNLYDNQTLETLLTGESVFEGVFECLRRIWDNADALEDRNLAHSEYRTRLLEQELVNLYPPLYDELQAAMGGHPITQLEDGCGVVMDGLSLREGFRLADELSEEHGWGVSLSWAPIERLPSQTEFICPEWFDARYPSAVSRDDYRYIGELEVPKLPATTPEFVWTRQPDHRLEGALKGNYASEEIINIYNDVKTLLTDIIHESIHTEFLVTSDHGYVNHLGHSPYSTTDEQEEALSNKLGGRFCEIGNSQAYRLLEDAGMIERIQDHYVVRGHYSWTKPGATKKIMHGGLSLTECLTPVLRISTTGAN